MNGCWPKWIVKAPIEYKACNWHDEMYNIWGSELIRLTIDVIFFYKMIIEKPLLFPVAILYFFIVILFGPFNFNYK